uniref:Uncharacterized protein n=1 Tax=Cucumis sativus TaxID=3659 RepID=A0A0A0L4Z6_CUCSA
MRIWQSPAPAADTVAGTSGVRRSGMQWLLMRGCVGERQIGFMKNSFLISIPPTTCMPPPLVDGVHKSALALSLSPSLTICLSGPPSPCGTPSFSCRKYW